MWDPRRLFKERWSPRQRRFGGSFSAVTSLVPMAARPFPGKRKASTGSALRFCLRVQCSIFRFLLFMECVGGSSVQHLQALSDLLTTQQEEEEDEDCKNVAACARLDPGHIGPPPKTDREVSTAYVKKNSKDIWSEEEVAEGSQYDDLADPRPQPEYEIILKQSVGTEDLFLGLSRKDPSSMCCEAMLVKIKLPDTKATDVVLDVREKFLDLRTPKYKLGLHLPHPTHSNEGKAQFFSEREELEVTLLMKRPMDIINLQ